MSEKDNKEEIYGFKRTIIVNGREVILPNTLLYEPVLDITCYKDGTYSIGKRELVRNKKSNQIIDVNSEWKKN